MKKFIFILLILSENFAFINAQQSRIVDKTWHYIIDQESKVNKPSGWGAELTINVYKTQFTVKETGTTYLLVVTEYSDPNKADVDGRVTSIALKTRNGGSQYSSFDHFNFYTGLYVNEGIARDISDNSEIEEADDGSGDLYCYKEYGGIRITKIKGFYHVLIFLSGDETVTRINFICDTPPVKKPPIKKAKSN
ncbi:MAG TPA: hypothetical protein VK808_04825 [Bacteroidia bacterium]|jgi:hypothetical protein|nr:hypothetical protein [Bacteroidia bacterium]